MNKNLKLFSVASLFAVISTLNISCAGRVTTLPKPSAPPISPTLPPEPQPSSNPNNPVNENSVDLSVVTLNCWSTPRGIFSDPTKDMNERFTNITNSVMNNDIVILQETYNDASEQLIIQPANYQYKVRYNNTSFGSTGSGLSVLSKYQFLKKDFKKFTQCEDSDCSINKGVFFTRLKVNGVGDVDLYNTHYQSGLLNEQVRLEANKELEAFIKKNDVGNPTIISGTFNFSGTDAIDSSMALKDFKKRFNPSDTFRLLNPQLTGFTTDPTLNPYRDQKEKPQRADYIFTLPENRGIKAQKINYKIEVLESSIIFNRPSVSGKFLSDHFGLNSKIRINVIK
jgi:hypothetical protein